MLTWLDHLCRQAASIMGGKWAGGDPRKAYGFHLQQLMHAVKNGTASFEDILDETF